MPFIIETHCNSSFSRTSCHIAIFRSFSQGRRLSVFNAFFLIYAVVQIFEIRGSIPADTSGISDIPVNILTAVIPIVISVAEIAYIALGWKIWREFGWKVYKRLGADRRVKRMFAQYQIFLCIMKFDVFFFIGFSIQLIWLVLNRQNWEWYVTCAALPCSFLLLVDGILAARYENKQMMISFMLGCVGAMVYFVYKACSKSLNSMSRPDLHPVDKDHIEPRHNPEGRHDFGSIW